MLRLVCYWTLFDWKRCMNGLYMCLQWDKGVKNHNRILANLSRMFSQFFFRVNHFIVSSCSNILFGSLIPPPLSSIHRIFSLVIISIGIFLWLVWIFNINVGVFSNNITSIAFHRITLSILNILVGRLNSFLYRCLGIGNVHSISTIVINIIGGRRIIDKRNVTLTKRELWSMINRPFSSLLRFWNNIFKAFSGLFIEYWTRFGAQHYLRVLQSTTIEEINQLLFSRGKSWFCLLIELGLWSDFVNILGISRNFYHLTFNSIIFFLDI